MFGRGLLVVIPAKDASVGFAALGWASEWALLRWAITEKLTFRISRIS